MLAERAPDEEACRASADCRDEKLCGITGQPDGRCVTCDKSWTCNEFGRCRWDDGACVATDADQCWRSPACAEYGRCGYKDGACIAIADEDCKKAGQCSGHGLCTLRGDACIAATDADCAGNFFCKGMGRSCKAVDGKCE